jgi:hypothetical protein
MKLPVQAAGVPRELLPQSLYTRSGAKSGMLPSCDPAWQVTCGSGCCDARSFFCLNNRCQPLE